VAKITGQGKETKRGRKDVMEMTVMEKVKGRRREGERGSTRKKRQETWPRYKRARDRVN